MTAKTEKLSEGISGMLAASLFELFSKAISPRLVVINRRVSEAIGAAAVVLIFAEVT